MPVLICALAGACASAGTAPAREVIAPPGTSTLAPYSPAVRSGGLVFLSGQIGLRPGTRELAAGGVAAETEQALENVRTVLAAADLTPADVVKCTVFLADMRDYDAMNAVYARFFDTAPPARSAVGVNGLPLGARVEIECIARDRK
ncbi:MAG: Rid family detoxifying hydrolase [Gemmatimonadetes bacterium]|nr:Rid family detoxifying hydrolase [Gemmatimonadota bacterium]